MKVQQKINEYTTDKKEFLPPRSSWFLLIQKFLCRTIFLAAYRGHRELMHLTTDIYLIIIKNGPARFSFILCKMWAHEERRAIKFG